MRSCGCIYLFFLFLILLFTLVHACVCINIYMCVCARMANVVFSVCPNETQSLEISNYTREPSLNAIYYTYDTYIIVRYPETKIIEYTGAHITLYILFLRFVFLFHLLILFFYFSTKFYTTDVTPVTTEGWGG